MLKNRLQMMVAFVLLAVSILHLNVEAKLYTCHLTVTGHRSEEVIKDGNRTTWTLSEEKYIPLGETVSFCWDDIGIDTNERLDFSVSITGPGGKVYPGYNWILYNYVYNPYMPMLGSKHISDPNSDSWIVDHTPWYMRIGCVDVSDEEVQNGVQPGVLFLGCYDIEPTTEDSVGKYTGTVVIGEEKRSIFWYVVDQPIKIVSNPVSKTIANNGSVTYIVSATGTNLRYQWYYNTIDSYVGGKLIQGATSPSYTVNNVTSAYNGRYYYCKVSNYSSTESYKMLSSMSSRAKLTVNTPQQKKETPLSSVRNNKPETKPSTPLKKKVQTIPQKGNLTTVKSVKARRVFIKWKKLSKVSGYQLYISRRKDFKGSVIKRNYKKSQYKINLTNVKSKKSYFIKLRPFKKSDRKKIYGQWSKVFKVRIK